MAVTYNSLVASIPKMLMAENRSWGSELAEVIRRAEDRVLLNIQPDLLKVELTGSLGTDDEWSRTIDVTELDEEVGAEFKGWRSLYLSASGVRMILTPKATDFCIALYPLDSVVRRPKHYAERIASVFDLYPYPDQGYSWAGVANVKPLPLGAGRQTNLLTEKAPALIETACFLEGALWMKDAQAAAIWQSAYEDLTGDKNANIRRSRRDDTTRRDRETENAGGAR